MLPDLRFAIRQLLKAPGFTAVSLLTLALGIGAGAAVFSVVDAVVLRPLAYPGAGRLVSARVVLPAFAQQYPTLPVNARCFQEWRTLPAFAGLAVLDRGQATLTGAGDALRISAVRASTNLFATLRVTPALGRSFSPDEDGAKNASVVILTDHLWRTRFNADPAIVGRTIVLDNRPRTVVGVLPGVFRLPEPHAFLHGQAIPRGEPEVFLPKEFEAEELNDTIGRFNYEVIGRLAPNITLAEAVAQMNVVTARLAKLSGSGLEVRSTLVSLQEAIVGPARRGLFLLLGAIAAVLLIACLNLSMLGLARAERRSRDFAVRSALGAGRTRLLREALTETLLLSLGGGALGWLVATWGLDVLIGFAPADLPRLDEVRLDVRVLGFAAVVTFSATLLAGIVPAWRAASTHASDVLQTAAGRSATGGRNSRRLRQSLIAIQAGMSTVLLAIAALLAASFVRVMQVDPGFHAPDVISTDIAIPSAKYRTDADRDAFHRRMLAEVAATPGVTSAAISTALPLQGETWVDAFWAPGDTRRAAERPQVNVRFVSPGYFDTLGIPLLAGRGFRDSDQGHDRVVISAQLAARLWPGQDAVGRKVLRGDNETLDVIGVVGDVRASADRPAPPMVYEPYWAWSPGRVNLLARIHGAPAAVAPGIRAAIQRLDGDVPVGAFRSMDDLLQLSVAQRRFQLRLVAAFAVSALLLVALGIYGVVAHSVAQRTRELGIRLAFGADPAALCRLVLRQGFVPIAWGLAGGILATTLGARLLASLLYETKPADPAVLGAVVALLALVAVLAAWLPARRATKVDPMIALRAE